MRHAKVILKILFLFVASSAGAQTYNCKDYKGQAYVALSFKEVERRGCKYIDEDRGVFYRCPGPPVVYTDSITRSESRERNCQRLDHAPNYRCPGANSAYSALTAAAAENMGCDSSERASTIK